VPGRRLSLGWGGRGGGAVVVRGASGPYAYALVVEVHVPVVGMRETNKNDDWNF
jgi:hypothetical protein